MDSIKITLIFTVSVLIVSWSKYYIVVLGQSDCITILQYYENKNLKYSRTIHAAGYQNGAFYSVKFSFITKYIRALKSKCTSL